MCRSTHKHTAPAHSQLSSQPHAGACTRACSWYPSSWCLCLFMLPSSFPLPSQVPEDLGALMLVAPSCSALFLRVPTGRNACVVVSDSLGVPRGCEWGSGWLCAPGDVLGLLVSHFPAGFCFPQLPSGWFSRICLCRSPSLGSCVGLSIQPPTEATHGCWCCGVGHGCCLPRLFRQALGFVFESLLPHTSSPALCAVVLFEQC